MKILVVSDTHGRDGNLEYVLEEAGSLDLLIHCGDVEGSEDYICEIAGCPVHMVAGNNDFFSDLNREEEFDLGDYRVWLTHGHNYGVSMGPGFIAEEARSRGVQIVMFGHTHRPYLEQEEDLTVLNPGSLSFPRQERREPSYILMEMDENGEIKYSVKYLKKSVDKHRRV